ncbi:YdeI/OmpD-associated family protein [Gelidibacter japonicus]|uniref:YdeI/OmpD-associated family protein n=1 Tax=Gelidibacter japonicus TaxID=1962232 RepID=UPI003A8D8D23
MLNEAFATDPSFKVSFQQFTSGKQREYVEYMESAKREATKVSRLDKIKPMILKGIGLHDKYRNS